MANIKVIEFEKKENSGFRFETDSWFGPSAPPSYSSSKGTYTKQYRIEYPDTIFLFYGIEKLSEQDLKQFEQDWREFCPH